MVWADDGDVATTDDLLFPALNPDGSIAFVPEDGHIFAVPAKYITQRSTNPFGGEKTFYESDGELIVTDARVIFSVPYPKRPGGRVVGHVRHGWITAVGWHPPCGMLKPPMIVVRWMEFDGEDVWMQAIAVDFPKTFHPSFVASEIARRVAAYDLRYGAPAETHAELQALLTPPTLPDPPKGEFADYDIPTWAEFPGGVPFHPKAPVTA